jgi:hypothetical protein
VKEMINKIPVPVPFDDTSLKLRSEALEKNVTDLAI